MTIETADRVRRAAHPLVVVLLAVQTLRLCVSFASGVTTVAQKNPDEGSLFRTGQKVEAFSGAGDGVGALILVLAVVLLWLSVRTATASPTESSRWRRNQAWAVWLLLLTSVAIVVNAVSFVLEFSAFRELRPWGELVQVVGFDVSYLVLTVGALYVLRGVGYMADAAADLDDELPAAVFAVDRRTGDVLAWPTMRKAVEEAPVYGVEDNEYDFFADDGTVLDAGIVDGQVTLTPTASERFDHLVGALQEFAGRRSLAVEADEVAEPLAYVDPISRSHWLQNWPGWMRPIARLVRPPR